MNRTKKSYCSNGEHPRWRHWRNNGVYTKDGFVHKVQCVECGAILTCAGTHGSPPANFVTSSRRWSGLGPLPEQLNNRLGLFQIPSRHIKLRKAQRLTHAN